MWLPHYLRSPALDGSAAAIAFDSSAQDTNIGASPRTWTHTCTGNNRLLTVISIGSVGVDDVSGVTYNGVAMTSAVKIQLPGGSRWVTLWYLLNPASGANTVSVNGSAQCSGLSASYTGVKQSGQPDATASNSSAGATSLATTLTTIADNCWTVGGVLYNNPTVGVGAGTTRRQLWSLVANFENFDSNGAITPPGSTSLNSTCTTSGPVGQVMASFSPA